MITMVNPTQQDIDWFRHLLEDYDRLVRDRTKCEDELDELQARIDSMFGVKAIRYDRVVVQGSSDPNAKERKRLEIIDKQIIWEEKWIRIDKKLDIIKRFRAFSDKKIAEAVFRIYCLKKDPDGERYTFEREAKKLYMHERTLHHRADAQIRKFLKIAIPDTFEP